MGGVMIGAAAIGAAGAIYSSNKAGKASNAANQTAQQDLAFQQQRYSEAQGFLNRAGAAGNRAFNMGLRNMINNSPTQVSASYGSASFGTASYGTAYSGKAYDAEATNAESFEATSHDMESVDAQAFDYEAAQAGFTEVDLSDFLDSFKEAMGDNTMGLEAFQERYGPIMDNVQEGILKVSQERLSAMGREQLTADAETLRKNFKHQMAVSGLARSGITVEMESRMSMDTAQQARMIDLQSHQQAGQLQAQGIQSLNSMEGIQQGILARRENIAMTRGQGQLSAGMQDAQNATNTSHLNAQMTNAQRAQYAQAQTQVDMQNANNATQANSQNANNATNVSMSNAQNATNVSMHNSSVNTNVSLANAQNKTNVSMGNAQNKTNVSMSNAQNATNVSMGNAAAATQVSMGNAGIANNVNMYNASAQNQHNNNISQAYMNKWSAERGAQLGFYAGVAAPNASNAINAQQNQANMHSQQAAGWASAAGTFAGKAYDKWQEG